MSRSGAARLPDSARKAAVLAREAVGRGVPVQAAVPMALESVSLSPEARRQAVDLAYWTLRGEVRCAHLLSKVFRRPEKLPPAVRRLLLAAAASLLFQEGAPPYAVVNGTVEDVRRLGGQALAGAANAGLRALLRLGDGPSRLDFYREPSDADGLSALFRFSSVPEELGRLLVRECGEEAARDVLAGSIARPLPCVRLNRARPGWEALRDRLVSEGAEPLPGPAGTAGLFCPSGRPLPEFSALAASGRLSLQSAGSQLVLAALAPSPDVPLWDACAGFGGKACALLEAGVGVALASDASPRRLSALPGECRRLGLRAPAVLLADGTRPPLRSWDGDVLVDAPCTGLGVLARRPDLKLRLPDVDGHAAMQEALLSSMLRLVPPGRRVLYATCTVIPRENGLLAGRVADACGADLESSWSTPKGSPFEGMYGAVLRRRRPLPGSALS